MKTQKEVNEWFSKNRIGKKDRKRADGFLMAHGLSIPELYNVEWAELDEFVGWFNAEKTTAKRFADVVASAMRNALLTHEWKHFNPETMESEDIWQPKEGEIVALKDDQDCVFAWRKGKYSTGFYCGVTAHGDVYINGETKELAMARSAPISPATPTQKKRFDDSLAKEGYVWNPSTLKAKKVLEVPENISILGCSEFFGNYMVAPGQSSDKKVRCKLVPCKREDFKAGDIAFATDMDDSSQKNLLEYYLLVLSDTESCYIEGNGSIEVNGCTWKHWYKVTPIE